MSLFRGHQVAHGREAWQRSYKTCCRPADSDWPRRRMLQSATMLRIKGTVIVKAERTH